LLPRGSGARAGAFTYDDEVRFFLLPVTRKVQPRIEALDAPPRLVFELPGVAVPEPATRTYPGALVRIAELTQQEGGARVVLTTSRPLGKHYTWRWSGNNMVVIFDHKPADPAPTQTPGTALPGEASAPKPTAVPQVTPTPHPVPTVALTPRPAPAASAAPTPTPRPVAVATPVPTATAQAASKPAPPPAAARPGFSFTGTIYNINSGEPLSGVRVTVGGRPVLTDRDGRFVLTGLVRGEHRVSVTAAGFAAQSFPILIPEDKSISLNLVPSL
jgi:hypothetical protein